MTATTIEIFLIGVLGLIIYFFRNLIVHTSTNWEYGLRVKAKQKTSKSLHALHTMAGNGKSQFEQWWKKSWSRICFSLVISFAAVILSQCMAWLLMAPAYALFQYYCLWKNAHFRKNRILHRIPFVLDILVLNLESGLDFLTSLEEIARLNDRHPLIDEIKLTLRSIHLGDSRSKAFENLSERTKIPELSQLTGAIRQSDKMGSSLTELLRLQSREIRYRIFKAAESEAQKAPVKILLPMLLLIFPVVFIVLFVPIGIQVLNVLH